jgi:hypothetical protein
MIRKVAYLVLTMALTSALYAQQTPTAPRDHDVYCAGMVTMTPPPADTYIISGAESGLRIVFNEGDLVFINRGSKQGVQVGSEFLVSRPVKERLGTQWFVWQQNLLRAMGSAYADIGRIRVVHVDANTSTAEIVLFCEPMERGDNVQPFVARPAPNYKPAAKIDIFAPPSGKEMAMVVATRGFGQIAYTGKVVYVNLGSAQGVHVGDYYRVFRYQGDRHSTVYQVKGEERAVEGFGSAPGLWKWQDLPRDILGEGMVLEVSQNASTVLITDSLHEIFAGDYVEIE